MLIQCTFFQLFICNGIYIKADQFFKIHIMLMPELLKIVEHYLSSLVLIHWKHLVSRLETGFVVQGFDPAINLDLYGDLCILGIQYSFGISCCFSEISTSI